MSEENPQYTTKPRTIFRTVKNADNPFVMIDRRPLENCALSWKAKGILAYLLSRPDNWTVRIGDLINRSPDGVSAIRTAIRELRKAGHVRRVEHRDPKTHRITEYTLEVYELPVTGEPLTDFLQAENLLTENRTLNNTNSTNTEKHGASAPNRDNLPMDWRIGTGETVNTIPDNEASQRRDSANLIGTGLGINAQAGAELAFAFQDERGITFTEREVKGQRRAVKFLLEKKVKPEHIREAVRKLVQINFTCADLFSVTDTAIDLANQPEKPTPPARVIHRAEASEGFGIEEARRRGLVRA